MERSMNDEDVALHVGSEFPYARICAAAARVGRSLAADPE